MKGMKTPELGGAYGSAVDELQNVIDDINSDEELFIISAKIRDGFTIYGYPGKHDKIRDQLEDMIDSVDNGIMVKIGSTWVNPAHLLTVRMIKYDVRRNSE